MIGLLDYDALASQKIRYPNLELMKMATYLRRIRQSFRLIVDFSDLEIYNEIYLFQNDSTLRTQVKCFRKKNVKGGLGWLSPITSTGLWRRRLKSANRQLAYISYCLKSFYSKIK